VIEADVIVVGSGASGVHAAWAVAEAGRSVALVDVGERDRHYAHLIPPLDFLTLRRTDPDQHRIFLGDDFEGVPFGPVRVGAQLTPPRQYLTRRADDLAPVLSAQDFAAMRSLALGGLAAGWGAASLPWLDEELADFPFDRADLQPHYDRVAARVGICGAPDDLLGVLGPLDPLLPPAPLDSNAAAVLRRYNRRREHFRRRGLHVGRARLALATRPFRGRGPCPLDDMDFWADGARAVYRPRYTIEELEERFPRFRYLPGLFAETFHENAAEHYVEIDCRVLHDGSRTRLRGRRLVLAGGVFGTARIVLQSLGAGGRPRPLLSNAYTYFPALDLNLVGKPVRDRRHSLSQLCMAYDPDGTRRHMVSAQLYSYRSLLLFKLVKESILSHADSIRILRQLSDLLVILGVHHEDRPEPGKWLALRPAAEGEVPALDVHFRHCARSLARQARDERRLRRFLLELGCLPLGVVRPGAGSSIHYAGTFPMRARGGPLTCAPDGRLRATRLVHLVDGSGFPTLPAKGLTLTLMANADRVGRAVGEHLS
jgi:choline dehydrogenase-like flavoprotein